MRRREVENEHGNRLVYYEFDDVERDAPGSVETESESESGSGSGSGVGPGAGTSVGDE